ncbi:probable 4-coumarate--CoA ligase 3 [Ornithodoros turicata]|uniref:probable 4-coumarate--CoA ligase 3 n=1 Tax=Ornithodoros turicata TaxID=34597 RepID=UPI003138C3B2
MKATIENGIVYSPYPDVLIPEISLYSFFKSHVQKHGDKVAAIEENRQWSFNEVLRSIECYAAGFQSIGLRKGDKVCVHVGNKFENLLAMYGVVAAGGTVVCSRPSLTPRELSYQIADSECIYVLTDSRNADKVSQVKDKHKLKAVFSMEAVNGLFSVEQFKEGVTQSNFKVVDVENTKEEVVTILYTSGTTGLPKGAQITHYGLVACLVQSLHSYEISQEDVPLCWEPITHASGFLGSTFLLVHGTTSVRGQLTMGVQGFVDTVNKHKVTSVFFFPTLLQAFVNAMETHGYRTPSIKSISVGGSGLSPSVAEKVLKLFNLKSFLNMYGLTESCALVCGSPSGVTAYDTIGFPAANVQIKIVDVATGRVLGPGEKGEMVVKLPNVMKGYYKKPEATSAVLSADDWLRTGDCAYYDEDGRFYFVERLKEMIKCLDNQLAPAEVEEVLLSHEAVAEAAVVGIPDPQYGEAPTAFVVLRASCHENVETVRTQLTELVKRECAHYKHLHGGCHFVERLPKTETGKVQRAALRESYVGIQKK